MTSITGKVFIGAGAASILAGAVFEWLDSGAWPTYMILVGISFILSGISLNVRGVRQKVTRGFSFGFLGAALVFAGIWLAANVPKL
jgi:hypothetical protein